MSPAVICREIKRNSTKTQGYRLVHADVKAERARARPQLSKVAADPVLQARVLTDLRLGRSPRAIAGRLAAEANDPTLGVVTGSPPGEGRRVSHPAVYSYVYALPRAELIAHGIRLDSGRVRRKPRKTPGKRPGPIIGMVSIEDRPDEVADRKIPGHWEGDLVRHEALCNRAEVKDLRRCVVAAA